MATFKVGGSPGYLAIIGVKHLELALGNILAALCTPMGLVAMRFRHRTLPRRPSHLPFMV